LARLHGCGARNSLVSLSLGEFRPLQLFRFCRRQNVACLRRQEKRCTDFAEGECPAFVAGVRVSFRKNKNSVPKGTLFLLAMGYKKDIFGIFAYEFELSQK